jgi:hypothetical protein
MASRLAIAAGIALVIVLPGLAQAQMDEPPANSFYADSVLPDPAPKPVHAFPASIATEDVAAVAPAADAAPKPQRTTPCTALSPCALVTPAARG